MSDKPESSTKQSHGGSRPGAGRPKGTGKWGEKTVPVRVPASKVTVIKDYLEASRAAEDKGRPLPTIDPDLLERAGLTLALPDETSSEASLPLFGYKIAAGFPSPADDYIEDRIDLNRHLIRHREATFFLRVQGDSMIDAGIHDGDLLVVDRALEPGDGKIVIAALDGELTVKRLSLRDGKAALMPENPDYPVIEIGSDQELVIWGVVTNVVHALD